MQTSVLGYRLLVTRNYLVIAKERETLKTLSYDCGNPVQYVCGHPPAVLFYLLDRHGRFTPSR